MKWLRFLFLGILVLAVVDCSKEDSPPIETETVPFVDLPQMGAAETPSISAGAPVVMSDEVKKRWKGVKIMVEDKQDNSTNEYTVGLQSEMAIPNSNLRIKVLDFLPDLKIEGSKFTSASMELLNPAVHVVIYEEGQEIFDGWLFQLFPSVHPFEHGRYNILLNATHT